ncbi:recombinase family protein [Bacillus salacetis]|uniref:recombinase family protein n=1 Tax=Bacillus salacetis TaxID=2315464 RepID=UPI003BA345E7
MKVALFHNKPERNNLLKRVEQSTEETPMPKEAIQVQLLVKEFRSKRIINGLRNRMEMGKGWGKPPLGYTFNHETKVFEIDEVFAWVIPAIDKMYLEGLGMQAIANKLKELSPIPDMKCWNASFVDRRLKSKVFHGVMEVTFKGGETITIEDKYPPLRSEEAWLEIQEVRKRRRKVSKQINY